MTQLDTAHAAMETGDDTARLRFYEHLAQTELHLLLRAEAATDTLSPEVFAVEGVDYVLAFDTLDRLSGFVGRAAEHASLPGRALVRMLVTRGLGLGLNLEAPSSMLLPPDAMGWLAQTLDHAPEQAELKLQELRAPGQLPDGLLTALDARLARMAGLARAAYLAGATYPGGARGHILVIEGAQTDAEPALAQAVSEALTFSGVEAGALDVAFVPADAALVARLGPVALRFDLPKVAATEPAPRKAPGSDPDTPPRLR